MKRGEKNCLLIIDPQNDFCSPDGSLYIPGSEKDCERLSTWIKAHQQYIEKIFVTLDTHNVLDISHPKIWVDDALNNPVAFTTISTDDIINKKWKSAYPNQFRIENLYNYLDMLEKQNSYPHCIWPEHCIIGTIGHAVEKKVSDALNYWSVASADARFVEYIPKGFNPLTEFFGAFKSEVAVGSDKDTQINLQLIDKLNSYDNIYLAGQAKSHCVATTLKQAMELSETMAKKIIILEDTMSNVTGFENLATSIFEHAREIGIRFEKTGF